MDVSFLLAHQLSYQSISAASIDPSLPRSMIRRSHKKSKQGCAECKRSHKKCDESRPSCVNCSTAGKQCSYTRPDSTQSPNGRDFIQYVGSDHASRSRSRSPYLSATSQTTSSSPQPHTPTTTPPLAKPYVNLLHLELYQNILAGNGFLSDNAAKDQWVPTMLRYTFSYPYLMYEALATSAFHLSVTKPQNSSLYLTESTTLQSKALSLFNLSTPIPTTNQEDLIPAFLFSALLGLHFFLDTFSSPSPDLNAFLDRLVQAIQLLRGIDATVGESWEYIKNSEIRCILNTEESQVARDDETTRAFEGLRARFSESRTLSAFESKVYCEAIQRLIDAYNSQPPESAGAQDVLPDPRIIMTWPITLSAEFAEFLNERRPEALVVLAYFSILLHSRRGFWAVGDAGRFLLAAIEEYLGDGWDEWLLVPRLMVPSL